MKNKEKNEKNILKNYKIENNKFNINISLYDKTYLDFIKKIFFEFSFDKYEEEKLKEEVFKINKDLLKIEKFIPEKEKNEKGRLKINGYLIIGIPKKEEKNKENKSNELIDNKIIQNMDNEYMMLYVFGNPNYSIIEKNTGKIIENLSNLNFNNTNIKNSKNDYKELNKINENDTSSIYINSFYKIKNSDKYLIKENEININ